MVDGGEGVRFEVERYGVSEPAFVVRYRSKVYAYLNRCAHVPVEIDSVAGRFFDDSGLYLICALHGALYAPESGRCLAGRCRGRGLVALPVTERDECIFLIEEGKRGGGSQRTSVGT